MVKDIRIAIVLAITGILLWLVVGDVWLVMIWRSQPARPQALQSTWAGSRPAVLAADATANDALDPGPPTAATLPIVMYHHTPADFEAQLTHLEQHGYQVIDLDQAYLGLHSGSLPPKPVVLTYDDGYADQMQAFEILKRHNMKATFYLFMGGETSRWCIGIDRRYGDPLQPPEGCGDAYLSRDQVKTLDHSDIITIAGHTLNHADLPTLTEDQQRFEIQQGKTALEQLVGHPIRHFAYPYGTHTETTQRLAQEAGYLTAVTTEAGTEQPAGSDLVLRRIHSALVLP